MWDRKYLLPTIVHFCICRNLRPATSQPSSSRCLHAAAVALQSNAAVLPPAAMALPQETQPPTSVLLLSIADFAAADGVARDGDRRRPDRPAGVAAEAVRPCSAFALLFSLPLWTPCVRVRTTPAAIAIV